MTVPKIPRSVPALAQLAAEHGWIVREPTSTLGDWGGKPDVSSVVLRMVHSESPQACYALWIDGKWRSASSNNPVRFFKTATLFKAFLVEDHSDA